MNKNYFTLIHFICEPVNMFDSATKTTNYFELLDNKQL